MVIKVWFEIGESVVRVGIKKFVVVNFYGGNVLFVDIFIRELCVWYDILVVGMVWVCFG